MTIGQLAGQGAVPLDQGLLWMLGDDDLPALARPGRAAFRGRGVEPAGTEDDGRGYRLQPLEHGIQPTGVEI